MAGSAHPAGDALGRVGVPVPRGDAQGAPREMAMSMRQCPVQTAVLLEQSLPFEPICSAHRGAFNPHTWGQNCLLVSSAPLGWCCHHALLPTHRRLSHLILSKKKELGQDTSPQPSLC